MKILSGYRLLSGAMIDKALDQSKIGGFFFSYFSIIYDFEGEKNVCMLWLKKSALFKAVAFGKHSCR